VRRRTAAVVVSSLILLFAAGTAYSLYGTGQQYASAATKAMGYLAANYNPSVGMVSETPNGNRYFVFSDNFLAAYVLENSNNATLRAIAANITSTTTGYLVKLPNPENQYQVITSGKGTFFASNDYILSQKGNWTVEITLNNGTSTLSPASYADIAFLEALYFHQVKSPGYSTMEYNLGVKLFDGKGFVDKAYAGQYQTYKLALYDYVSKVLGVTVPGLDDELVKLQAPNGGFYTEYGADLSLSGSTNTETTCLAVMALSDLAAKAPQSNSFYLPAFGSAVAAVVVAEVAVMRRRYKRRDPWSGPPFY